MNDESLDFTLKDGIIASEIVESLPVVNNRVRIKNSEYFYVPDKHVGIVTLNGIFQRNVFTGIDKVKNPEEVISVETTKYNDIEVPVDVTYRDGSMYRLYETIRYRFNMNAIHARNPAIKYAVHLIYPKFYPMVKKTFVQYLPEDSYAHINQYITKSLRRDLIQDGIWISIIYTPYKRKITKLICTGAEYEDK